MNVNDMPLVMQPHWVVKHLQFAVHPSVAKSCLTFHNFSCSDFIIQEIAPHNLVVVQSNDDWPLCFLFDVTYGCAALKTWGVKEFVQFTWGKTKVFYYHNVDYDDDGDDSDNSSSVRGTRKWAMVCWFKLRKQVVICRVRCWRRQETVRQLML